MNIFWEFINYISFAQNKILIFVSPFIGFCAVRFGGRVIYGVQRDGIVNVIAGSVTYRNTYGNVRVN